MDLVVASFDSISEVNMVSIRIFSIIGNVLKPRHTSF